MPRINITPSFGIHLTQSDSTEPLLYLELIKHRVAVRSAVGCTLANKVIYHTWVFSRIVSCFFVQKLHLMKANGLKPTHSIFKLLRSSQGIHPWNQWKYYCLLHRAKNLISGPLISCTKLVTSFCYLISIIKILNCFCLKNSPFM